jgi:hypothetical protein
VIFTDRPPPLNTAERKSAAADFPGPVCINTNKAAQASAAAHAEIDSHFKARLIPVFIPASESLPQA